MRLADYRLAAATLAVIALSLPGLGFAAGDERPNILLVVFDDLGYSDLGAYGGEIATPHVDALAARGVMFTDFHATMTCSPSRAMLLTGVDHHRAGLGTMAGHMSANQTGQPGYEGRLNQRVTTIAQRLAEAGYRTIHTGKWHLGKSPGSRPHERGFQRSFSLLDAGASYFNDMRGLVERTPRATYLADGESVNELPEDFHASVYFADRMIDYLDESVRGGSPFFGYLALTAPHWPYHLPDAELARYRGRYDAGYEQVRRERFARMQSMGLIGGDFPFPARLPGVEAWTSLSSGEQRRQARAMELYAALVSHADEQIGRVLEFLERADVLERTVIFLLSDNGAEGNDRSRIATNATWLSRAWDLSYENMGRRDSYVYYGPGWAQVSSTPLHLFKAYPTEGGIRVPLIVAGPGIDRPGRRSGALTTVRDIVPTMLDVAGSPPSATEGGHADNMALDGVSLLPHLHAADAPVHAPAQQFGWELFGHRALREGRWKLMWVDSGTGEGDWQLFDLSVDPGESRDLRHEHPIVAERLIAGWKAYARDNQVVLPADDQSSAFGY